MKPEKSHKSNNICIVIPSRVFWTLPPPLFGGRGGGEEGWTYQDGTVEDGARC